MTDTSAANTPVEATVDPTVDSPRGTTGADLASSAQVSCCLTPAGLSGLVVQAKANPSISQVIVTRSVEAAVAVREQLAPTRYFDDSGLPLSARNQAGAAVLLAQAPAHERRVLLARFQEGTLKHLVLAASGLAAPGLLDALATAGGPWIWRVQDASGLLLESPSFQPELLVLQDALARGLVSSFDLYATHVTEALRLGLQQRLGREVMQGVCPELPAAPVKSQALVREGLLSSRTVLTEALKQLLTTSDAAGLPRALMVLPEGGVFPATLPTEELVSLAQELGFSPQVMLQEESEGALELWAERVRHTLLAPAGLALTAHADPLQGFLPGGEVLLLRLQPPESLEVIRDEHALLRHLGGGTWAALFEPTTEPAMLPTVELARVLAERVLALAGTERRVVVDVESLLPTLKAQYPALPDRVVEVGRLVRKTLDLWVGAGLFRSVRTVHALLEVAEAHRFASPHIDIDPRYVQLKERYEAALAGMGLLEAVGHKLNARGRRDLRILAPRLGYSVAELNVLFADLAREGLLLARGVTSGLDPANLDLEITLSDDAQVLQAHLPGLLQRVDVALSWRQAARSASQAWCLNPSQEALDAHGEQGSPAVLEIPRIGQGARGVEEGSGGSQGVERAGTPAPAELPAARPSALPQVEAAPVRPVEASRVAASGAWASGALSAERLSGLYRHVMAAPVTSGRVRQLRTSLADASGDIVKVAAFLLTLLEGETGQAGSLLLEMLRQTPPLPGLEEVLPALLNALELRVGADDGGPLSLSDELEPWRTLLLLVPVLEDVSSAEQTQLLKLVEPSYPVLLSGLGSLTLTLGPSESLPTPLRLGLERQALEPELEAAIWLEVDRCLLEGIKSRDPRIPACLIRARLAEAYRLLEGISSDPVLEPLRLRILAEACHGAWMGEARHAVAVALARQQAGQIEAALELLRALASEQRSTLEVTRLEVQLELRLNEPLRALQRLELAAHDIKKGLGQSTWQKLVSALQGVCVGQEVCDGCPLGGSSFCPSGDGLLELQEQNPFQEGRKPLQLRLDKRGKAGFQPSDASRLLALLSRYGTGFSPEALSHWMQSTREARPEVSLALAQHAFDNGAGDAALLGLDEALGHRDPAQPSAVGLLTGGFKLYLGLGRLGDALRLAEELLESAAGRSGRELTGLLTELDTRLTPGWQDRLESFAEGLTEPALHTLARLGEKRAHKERLASARSRLERSVRQGHWKDLVEGMAELTGLLGDAPPGVHPDPLLVDAKKRLEERARKVESRLKTLLKGEIDPRGAKLELDKLKSEAPLLGLESLLLEASTQVEQRLAQLPPPGAEAVGKPAVPERAGESAPEASASAAPGDERPPASRAEGPRDERRRPEHRSEQRPEQRPEHRSEQRPDERRRDGARPDQPRSEQRPDERRRDGARPEQGRPEQGRSEQGRSDQGRPEQGRSEHRSEQRPDERRRDGARPEQPRSEQGRSEQRPDERRRDGARPDQPRSEQGRPEGRASEGQPRDARAPGGAQNPSSARSDRSETPRGSQEGHRRDGGMAGGSERRTDAGPGGPRRGGPQDGRRGDSGRQDGSYRGGDRRPESGRQGESGRADGARGEGARAEAPVPRLEGPALLEGLKAAQGDRDRARLVMAVLPETLSADAEKGIRLVRDSLPIFERVGAMDGALARLVREGQVPDPSLARFKRVLEKFHAGHHLTSTFEAISSREAPEAWKVALSQLKLGG